MKGRNSYDPYEALANAIVLQAVEDYRALKNGGGINRRMSREQTEKERNYKLLAIEHFFLSDYFKLLTAVDGRWLLDKLKKEEE